MACKLPSSWKVIAFTLNLLCGLMLSQVLGACLPHGPYKAIVDVISFLTMWALSFIMINVGYEFTIDTKALSWYVWDYLIAMTAAGFPWLFVAMWYLLTLNDMKVDEAFLIARFAAPTSAGILFSMLEAAGLRETWVFQKARILAIFDDLDTIILMIPLKIAMIGFKVELIVVIVFMVAMLGLMLWKLHAIKLPFTWKWTLLYAAIASVVCKLLHYVTHHHVHDMDPIHIEVLLPAFVIGCIIDTPCARLELAAQRKSLEKKMSIISNASSRGSKSNDPQLMQVVPAPAWERQISSASTSPGSDDVEVEDMFSDEDEQNLMHPHNPGPVVVMVHGANGSPKANGANGTSCSSSSSSSSPIDGQQHALSSDRPNHCESEQHIAPGGDEDHEEDPVEQKVQTIVSMVFMILVGLSMPAMIGKNAKESGSSLGGGSIAAHVAMVTFLMIIGKMFPVMCYRDEASLSARLALCLGMCPRGEVGASIIVISLDLGISGPAIIISMCALVINLVMSGGFIASVKMLLKIMDADGDGIIDEHEWRQHQAEHIARAKARSFSVAWHVRFGAGLLALCAGMVNAVAFNALKSFVSHATGTFTKMGLGMEDSSLFSPGDTCLLLLSFVVGSIMCGCFIGEDKLHFGLALYDFGLIIEAVLLVMATVFANERKLAANIASMACGLQNGLATTWGGAVIRTTHVTGLFTDVGLLTGRVFSQLIRNSLGKGYSADDKIDAEDDLSKLSVLLSIGAAFLVGAFVGAHLYNAMDEYAFLVPASITGAAGLAYAIYRVFILRQKVFSFAAMSRRTFITI